MKFGCQETKFCCFASLSNQSKFYFSNNSNNSIQYYLLLAIKTSDLIFRILFNKQTFRYIQLSTLRRPSTKKPKMKTAKAKKKTYLYLADKTSCYANVN